MLFASNFREFCKVNKVFKPVSQVAVFTASEYRIAGKFGGGKVWQIGQLLARKSLANVDDSLNGALYGGDIKKFRGF